MPETPLTEYHLSLPADNQTRRLWAEHYLESPLPKEQGELNIIRASLASFF